MRDNLKIIYKMDKANTHGKTEIFMKVNGKMIINLVKEFING